MKNNITQLFAGQISNLQTLIKMKAWMNGTGMVIAKVAFSVLIFLSITIESNAQDMTFAENDINQTPMGVRVSGNMLMNDCDPTHDAQWLKSVTFFNGLGGQHPGLIGGRPFPVCAENGISAGTMSIYLDGRYDFDPTPNFKGELLIYYVVENSSSATDAAMLLIQVIPPDNPMRNDRPIAHNDTNTTEMDVDVAGNVITFNDYDLEDDVLTVSAIFGDIDGDGVTEEPLTVGVGTVVYGMSMSGDPAIAGTLILNADGSYNFDPVAEFYGKLSIEYNITDNINHGIQANLTIFVSPEINSQSFANDDINTGKINTQQSGNILTNDEVIADNDLTIVGAKNNFDIPLVVDGITENELRSTGTVVLDTDGSFTYSPKIGFVGTELVSYIICDAAGTTTCDTATLYLTTIPSNGSGIGSVGNVGVIGTGLVGRSSAGEGSQNNELMDLSLYPNPGIVGNDFINLNFTSLTEKAFIQVVDMTGRVVKELSADMSTGRMNSLEIDVKSLMEGSYHLQLIDGENRYTKTFILID